MILHPFYDITLLLSVRPISLSVLSSLPQISSNIFTITTLTPISFTTFSPPFSIFPLPPYPFNVFLPFSLLALTFLNLLLLFASLLLRSKSTQHFYPRLRIRYCVYVLNQIRQETLDQLRLAEISGLLNTDCRPSQPAWIGYVVSVSHSMLLPMPCLFGSIQRGYTALCTRSHIRPMHIGEPIYIYIPRGEPLVTTSNYVQSDHSAISKMDMLRLRKYSVHRRGTKAL